MSLINSHQTLLLFAILCLIASLSIYLERYQWGRNITGCVIALLLGMALSNLHIIPTTSKAYDFVWDQIVPLSIPLLLFQANLKTIYQESGRMLIIYLLSSVGTLLGGLLGYLLLRHILTMKVLPMLIGTYTGGSMNLIAMADAFHVSQNVVSASIVADNLTMVLYFFVLIVLPSQSWILKHLKHPYIDHDLQEISVEKRHHDVSLEELAFCLSISLAIVATSTLLGETFDKLIPTNNFALAFLHGILSSKYLLMTTLTMVLATLFGKTFRKMEVANTLGTYMMYIFFAVIGVPASIAMMLKRAPLLVIFTLIICFINLLFTLAAGKLLHFSIEEILIASNANVGGPTTACAMANARGWKALIVPSLLMGTLGYIIGNYLGIFSGLLIGLK